MVKNTTGGKGAKSMASKNVAQKGSSKLRVAEFSGEIYAIVTKYLGNCMFHCHCMDNVSRLGHIRGKFAGRGKKDNIISPGVWVLIGLREWENGSTAPTVKNGKTKLQQCDLLEVYSDTDKRRLRDSVNENWELLVGNDPTRLEGSNSSKQTEEDVDFSNLKDEEIDKLIEDLKTGKIQKLDLDTKDDNQNEEINIDDI
jgi:initiation factor 1A